MRQYQLNSMLFGPTDPELICNLQHGWDGNSSSFRSDKNEASTPSLQRLMLRLLWWKWGISFVVKLHKGVDQGTIVHIPTPFLHSLQKSCCMRKPYCGQCTRY